jgi:MFS superfamily sulfate permease-like transporter
MAAVSGLLCWSLGRCSTCRSGVGCCSCRVEFGIALATLTLTLAIRLELAILFGTLLSLAAYSWRTARPAVRTMGFDTAPAAARS